MATFNSLKIFAIFGFSSFLLSGDFFKPLIYDAEDLLKIESFRRIPCRIQYHGFIEVSSEDRFIFSCENSSLRILTEQQTGSYGFSILKISPDKKTILIQDHYTNNTYELISGVITFLPEEFEAVLWDSKQKKRFTISNKCLSLPPAQRFIVPEKTFRCLYIIDFEDVQKPHAACLKIF